MNSSVVQSPIGESSRMPVRAIHSPVLAALASKQVVTYTHKFLGDERELPEIVLRK